MSLQSQKISAILNLYDDLTKISVKKVRNQAYGTTD